MASKILGIGSSAIVAMYDENTVVKGYMVVKNGQITDTYSDVEYSRSSLEHEFRVYQRLGSHENLLQCYGLVEVLPGVHSLRLELASKGNLRSFIETSAVLQTELRLAWCIDITAGLSYMHSLNVFHCDFSCRNIGLTETNTIKIFDFGGAGMNGNESEGVEEPRYELPCRGRKWEDRPYKTRDIFALGSCIYEIMAWKKPFAELEDLEVARRYECEEFPDLSHVSCSDIIRKCWSEEYGNVEEVMRALKSVEARMGSDIEP